MMKKVTLFYLIDNDITYPKYPAIDSIINNTNNDIDSIISHKNGYDTLLYAFTPEKRIAKEFKLSRDMNKFISIDLNMSDDTYEDFVDEYEYALIENHQLMTSYVDNHGIIRGKTLIMHYPTSESDALLSNMNIIGDDLGMYLEDLMMSLPIVNKGKWSDIIDDYLDLFNPDMKRALVSLGIVDVFYNYSGIGYDDETAPPFSVIGTDTLQLYCMLFGNTYSDNFPVLTNMI